MKRSAGYSTKQREAILSYIASLGDGHVTAGQVAKHFQNGGFAIGTATIYRHLDRLVENGQVRKYNMNSTSGACFQYVSGQEGCREHFHLKCEDCGALLHLSCDWLTEIPRHVLDAHTFQINPMKTVFYGRCGDCLNRD